METRAIALVHIFAHEAFHYLRRSQQIPGRNRENEADQFALSIEATFRERMGSAGTSPEVSAIVSASS
jgi:hypothetical protein